MQVTKMAPFVPAPIEDAPTVRVYGPDDILLDWSRFDYALGTANRFAYQYEQQFTHIDVVDAEGKHTVIVESDVQS